MEKRKPNILLTVALVLLVLLVRTFLVGNKNYTTWAPMHLEVQGKELSFDAIPTDSECDTDPAINSEISATVLFFFSLIHSFISSKEIENFARKSDRTLLLFSISFSSISAFFSEVFTASVPVSPEKIAEIFSESLSVTD